MLLFLRNLDLDGGDLINESKKDEVMKMVFFLQRQSFTRLIIIYLFNSSP